MMGFVDIETSGLDHDNDWMLEVGLVVMDDDLMTVCKRTQAVLSVPSDVLIRIERNEVVYKMHTASGLLDEVQGPSALKVLDAQELFVEAMDDFEEMPMCGSSVHFDRAFLRRWMPVFEACFTYRCIDVSSLKELAARWWPQLITSRPPDRKMHRALPDIEDSIRELAHYRRQIDMAFDS